MLRIADLYLEDVSLGEEPYECLLSDFQDLRDQNILSYNSKCNSSFLNYCSLQVAFLIKLPFCSPGEVLNPWELSPHPSESLSVIQESGESFLLQWPHFSFSQYNLIKKDGTVSNSIDVE